MYQVYARERCVSCNLYMSRQKWYEADRTKGAPAIAIVAALALAVELEHKRDGKL